MRRRNIKRGQEGIALILSLGVLAILLILAVTFAFNTRLGQRAARNYMDYLTAGIHLKGGVEHAVATIKSPSDDASDDFQEGKTVSYLASHPDFPGAVPYEYHITPESGSLNLNFTGNLLGGASHLYNQGWTTFEISIAKVLEALLEIDESTAEQMAEDIIRYRYNDGDPDGGEDAAGDAGDTYDAHLQGDGIDHDGSGGPEDDTDPSWFSERFPRPGHKPFTIGLLETELEGLDWVNTYPGLWSDWHEIWDEIKGHVIVETRSDGELESHPANINAAEDAGSIFDAVGLSVGTFAQKAANILDYRDANHAVSVLELAQAYYGVESILINEVLANSYDVREVDSEGQPLVNALEGVQEKEFTFDGLAPNTAYRLRLWSEQDNFDVRVGREEPPALPDWGPWALGEGWNWVEDPISGYYYIDYPGDDFHLSRCVSNSAGELIIESRPEDDQVHEDIPPGPMDGEETTIDEIEYAASASGEHVVYDNGDIIEERPAWHAFDEDTGTWWRVDTAIDEEELPPEPMTGPSTAIDGVTYKAAASGEKEGYEPWRAFGEPADEWRSEISSRAAEFPPPMSSNTRTYRGVNYAASASHESARAYRAFDNELYSCWEVEFDAALPPGIPVYSIEDLDAVRDELSWNYVLMRDLDFNDPGSYDDPGNMGGYDNWAPIGGGVSRFTGAFYGRGHTISGLSIDRPGEDYVGLFGAVGPAGSLLDLILEDAEVSGRDFTGAAAGFSLGYIREVRVEEGEVRGMLRTGGLAGENRGLIMNSYSSASVAGQGGGTGGLVGVNCGGMVWNSRSTGGVGGDDYTGGLAGLNTVCEDLGLESAVAASILDSSASGPVAGADYVGGLAGANVSSVIFSSGAYGEVSGVNSAGGLAGSNVISNVWPAAVAVISRSYARGGVVLAGSSAGGLAGLNEGSILNSYARGGVEGGDTAGGLVGYNSGIVDKTYSTGVVSGDSGLGGLMGGNSGSVENSFWDIDSSGQGSSAGGTGKSPEEMRDVQTYTDTDTPGLEEPWDFKGNPYDDAGFLNIWDIDGVENDGYPFLEFLPPPSGGFPVPEVAWIEIDLGRRETISALELVNCRRGVERFDLRARNPGTGWVNVITEEAHNWKSSQNFNFPPARYRYWRLYPRSLHYENRLAIDEIRMLSTEHDLWISLDLGEKRTVHAMELSNVSGHGIGDFILQARDGGGRWSDILEGRAQDTGARQRFEISPPRSYREWRVYAESLHDSEEARVRDIKFFAREAEPPEWIALDMGVERAVHSVRIRNIPPYGVRDFRVRASNFSPPGEGEPLPPGWKTVYSGTAQNILAPQTFSFKPEEFRYWALELVDVFNAGGRVEISEIKYIGEEACVIERVEFAGPEFIELVNIGGEEIDLSGWEVETPNSRSMIGDGTARERDPGNHMVWDPSGYIIAPGEYFVLTNDMLLFAYSFGDADYDVFPLNCVVVDMDGWITGAAVFDHVDAGGGNLGGELGFAGDGIYLYDNRGRLAELALTDDGIANVSMPGRSGMLGVSREKNDPSVRDFWWDADVPETAGADERGATPGKHNTRISAAGEDILDDLRGGDIPHLVKNNPLSIGEVVSIPDMGYPGVRSGRQWRAVGPERLGRIARRLSAYYIRLDAETAVPPGMGWVHDLSPPEPYPTEMYRADSAGLAGTWEWEDVRLDPGIKYALYVYGIYSGDEDDDPDIELTVRVDGTDVESFTLRYGESDGAYAGVIDGDHIDGDGGLTVRLESLRDGVYFDYIMLVPDGVPGKININAASREVLMGLPGIDLQLAGAIRDNRPYTNISQLLERNVLSPPQYAPLANLAAVSVAGASDTYRVLVTGRSIGPGGRSMAERRLEMLVHKRDDEVRIISWKYLYD